MTAGSIILWVSAVFIGLSGAMMLAKSGAATTSLEQGLGPLVETVRL